MPSLEVAQPALYLRRSVTAEEAAATKRRVAEIKRMLDDIAVLSHQANDELLGVSTPSYLGRGSIVPTPALSPRSPSPASLHSRQGSHHVAFAPPYDANRQEPTLRRREARPRIVPRWVTRAWRAMVRLYLRHT